MAIVEEWNKYYIKILDFGNLNDSQCYIKYEEYESESDRLYEKELLELEPIVLNKLEELKQLTDSSKTQEEWELNVNKLYSYQGFYLKYFKRNGNDYLPIYDDIKKELNINLDLKDIKHNPVIQRVYDNKQLKSIEDAYDLLKEITFNKNTDC